VPHGIALNLLASALTILAAIALLGSAAMVGDASVATPVRGTSDGVVRDFYDAVNDILRTGDTAAFDQVIAADLVFHSPSPGITPNRMGLERHLAAIRADVPGFQLHVQDIIEDSRQAAARVVGTSIEPGGFLGLRFATTPIVWGELDVFRIEHNRVVEMRFGAPAPVLLESARQVRVDSLTSTQSLSLERLTVPAGKTWELGPLFDRRVLYMDAGVMTIAIAPSSSPVLVFTNRGAGAEPDEVEPGTVVALSAGDVAYFPSDARYTFRRSGDDPDVVAFAIVLPRFSYNGPLQPHTRPGNEDGTAEKDGLRVVHTSLLEDVLPDALEAVTISFGRAVLPPGASVSFREADGPAREADGPALIAIESGSLILQADHTTATIQRVNAGNAARVMPDAPVTISNLGDIPAAFIAVTILPNREGFG
jgi:hypothetical protein